VLDVTVSRKRLAWLVLAVLLIAAYPYAFKLGSEAWFVSRVDAVAGSDATNCGHIKRGTDPSQALTCLSELITIKRPFKVAFDVQGVDSQIALAVAKSANGPVTLLRYDSNPGGSCLYLCSPLFAEEPCYRLTVRAERVAPAVPLWNVHATCERR